MAGHEARGGNAKDSGVSSLPRMLGDKVPGEGQGRVGCAGGDIITTACYHGLEPLPVGKLNLLLH